jgi:mannose-6-phosphate isomerase-like protein (cupin superfamily)
VESDRPTPTSQEADVQDSGPQPFVTDIERATLDNDAFRTSLWTGTQLQLTVMCLQPGEEIGLEVHRDRDQFLRVEEGSGLVEMGVDRDALSFRRDVGDGDVVLVPAGSWHNVTSTGEGPLRLYSIYGPPEHPHGTIHRTKAEAESAERDH